MNPKNDPSERFTHRVDDYVKYRPNYPPEIIALMTSKMGLTKESIIVDVGSGTGISSELFLRNGNIVHGVEPNDKMRMAAEQNLKKYPTFHTQKGTSESTGLVDHMADFVIAAQSFHWFEPIPTKKEFQRILKENGRTVLIWNDRKFSGTAFAVEYEALITLFSRDYHQVKSKNIGEKLIRDFLGPFELHRFSNHQELDFESLLGRLMSSSYAPEKDDPRFAEMKVALRRLFEKFQSNGHVSIEYETQVYSSVSRPSFIKHYSEIQQGAESSYYRGTKEFLSIGSPFAKSMGLSRLGIHHEWLPPGRRTSWPHAESAEEEFVYVIEGNPDAWINGQLHRLSPGDGVSFPSGTGISHTFINDTKGDVRLLVVGETSKKENKVYYPLNPSRRQQCQDTWWHDIPKHDHGSHDGMPDKLRGSEALGPLNYTGEIIIESLHDKSVLDVLETYRIKSRRAEMPNETLKVWNINRYCIDEDALNSLLPRLEQSIGPGWYIHFFSDLGNRMFVIFVQKHFLVSKTKDESWEAMIRFGESVGVESRWTESIPTAFRD